jgi:hypothetical protein
MIDKFGHNWEGNRNCVCHHQCIYCGALSGTSEAFANCVSNIGPAGYDVEIIVHTPNGDIQHNMKLVNLDISSKSGVFSLRGEIL